MSDVLLRGSILDSTGGILTVQRLIADYEIQSAGSYPSVEQVVSGYMQDIVDQLKRHCDKYEIPFNVNKIDWTTRPFSTEVTGPWLLILDLEAGNTIDIITGQVISDA